MLKKTVTYNDLEGNEISEDFYFNLNKAEIARMAVSRGGNLEQYFKTIVAANDGEAIMDTFEELIGKCYGIRSENGKSFLKSPEITRDFVQSEAYSALFMELVTNAESAAQFINAVVPQDLIPKTTDIQLPTIGNVLSKDYSVDELVKMSDDEFHLVAGDDVTAMTKNQLVAAVRRKTVG